MTAGTAEVMIRGMRDTNIVLARERRFRRHLQRVTPALARLRGGGRVEPNVLAILAVESFYRPRPLRAVEYAAWAMLTLLAPRRIPRISVGVAQLRLENWRALGMIDSTHFSLARLRRVRDVEANYEACRRYLNARGALHQRDPERLGGTYAGGQRHHFALMLGEARSGLAASGDARTGDQGLSGG